MIATTGRAKKVHRKNRLDSTEAPVGGIKSRNVQLDFSFHQQEWEFFPNETSKTQMRQLAIGQ